MKKRGDRSHTRGVRGREPPPGPLSECSSPWCRSPLGYEPYDCRLCPFSGGRDDLGVRVVHVYVKTSASPPSHRSRARLAHKPVHAANVPGGSAQTPRQVVCPGASRLGSQGSASARE